MQNPGGIFSIRFYTKAEGGADTNAGKGMAYGPDTERIKIK